MQGKRVAFLFMSMSHGGLSAQEGLDVSLATCVLSEQLGVFFLSDGVFLLLSHQKFDKKFRKQFVSSFEILLLCGVCDIYLCADSALERGLIKEMNWIYREEVVWLSAKHWRERLLSYDIALRF